MAATINIDKVVNFSMKNVFKESNHQCATYTKKAFAAGGCTYVSGNGFENQRFCELNGFKCIGDFTPIDKNPRAHNGIPMQFPEGYQQRKGDICLIKHGQYGHMCYAFGWSINDWVSDYIQNSNGPYCYSSGYERVQFWRNENIDVGKVDTDVPMPEPITNPMNYNNQTQETEEIGTGIIKHNVSSNVFSGGGSNNIYMLSVANRDRSGVLKQEDMRRGEFEALRNSMTSSLPELGRDVMLISSEELFDSNILKGDQESKKERN